MATRLPMLYKKTSTGKIQTWEVVVRGATMYSESGQLGGKKVKSEDTIKAGKNIGKANETSREEQAVLEAESRWRGKKKKGYVECLDDASNDVVSDYVEGGIIPTLAHQFEKREKDIVFPCAAQPKLDGIRSTYTGQDNMWSRTRKKQISVPHVPRALAATGFRMTDGELYNHELKHDFEKITHIVGQKKTPTDNHEIVEYHVYDIPSDKLFRDRIKDLIKLGQIVGQNSPIKVVETVICVDKEDLLAYREECLEKGYEGCMVRNLDAPYENKRSKHLQKLKIMEDAEFEIVGVNEGRGKLTGSAGSFICKTSTGDEFDAKLKGKLADLEEYWVNKDNYIGKQLTVQFQGYTNKNNVPRFPVGLRIREPE